MAKAKPDVAVLVIDVINDLDFPGAQNMQPWAERMVRKLAPFCKKARRAGVPVVYVNDNFGHWRSDFQDVYRHCTRKGARGSKVSRALKPTRNDYFILKPKHSGFFATSLQPLLEFLGTRKLILAGVATNICVFFTAHDAHMREYPITVLSDCCAAESDFDHNAALDQLKRFCRARIVRSDQLKL